ncbi:MAG: NYN domain-containing protein [Desulfobacteraceae bacterium]|nr:NYN domain-containing protein [Desulfobacteraceae bacterium]
MTPITDSSSRDIQAGGDELAERHNTQHRPQLSFLSSRLKVACFIDWENVRKQLFTSQKGKPFLDYNNPSLLNLFVRSFLDLEERFYRIFLYTSRPIASITHQGQKFDLSSSQAYKKATIFIDTIGHEELFAVRLGKLKVRDVHIEDGVPKFRPIQKQVDMLMGLDIAHLSYLKLVDRILVFSYDNDIVPALKTARVNGIQVAIAECPDRGRISDDLRRHTDFVRSIKLSAIMDKIKNNLVTMIDGSC